MDDDDGLMLNFKPMSNSKPMAAAIGKKKKSTSKVQPKKKAAQPVPVGPIRKHVPQEQTNEKKSAEIGDNPSKSKVIHGKAQVISSIFSSNPEIKLPKAPIVKKNKNMAPSNAPVADSTTFVGLGIESDLVNQLKEKINVESPTNVQRKAIPILLGPTRNVRDADILGHDVDAVIQAETGSGKTLTYLLPIINRLLETPRDGESKTSDRDRGVGTLALILTPTHELALQVATVAERLVNFPKSYGRPHWIVTGHVTGGFNKSKEKLRLKKGTTILVATPGRLLDHLTHTENFNISNLKWLVLDEADRLLDLGFEDTLKQIMEILNTKTKNANAVSKFWPQRRQTILCSATLREDVKNFAGEALIRPVFVSGMDVKEDKEDDMDVDAEDTKYSTPSQLKQSYSIVSAKLRLVSLVTMLRSSFFNTRTPKARKVIVFFSSIDSTDFHFDLLANAAKERKQQTFQEDYGDKDEEKTKKVIISEQASLVGNIPLYRLHGDMKQNERKETYESFGRAKTGILLCTDVAARGLDMPHVDHIIQYDPPVDIRDYVHRAGRTARLGQSGNATIFLLPSEMEYVEMLKAQGLSVAQLDIESVLKYLEMETHKGNYQTIAQNLQNMMEEYVLRDEETITRARKAYWSSIKAYSTHGKAEKHVFHVNKLHLGHMAKSFALREAPQRIKGSITSKKQTKNPGDNNKEEKPKTEKKTMLKRARALDTLNEFSIMDTSTYKAGPTARQKKRRKN
ncbi:P-loop containing nucleoside triphosphate hydrolase protein [Dichotomocladium elegans]|nr:P-loop containing nucleoside triphosphate hydrolase protein [Dichotomocladium elegans]